MALGHKRVVLWQELVVGKFPARDDVFENVDLPPPLRVLEKLRPCQHGARQFLMLKRPPSVHSLHRDLYGDPKKRKASSPVAVLSPLCAPFHEPVRKLPRRKRPSQRWKLLLVLRSRPNKVGSDIETVKSNIRHVESKYLK